MLFHPQIRDVAAVTRKNRGLRHSRGGTVFIRVPEKEFTRLNRRPRAWRRLHSSALDNWLREPVAVSKMFVCVVEWRNALQIEGGEKFDSPAFSYIALVLVPAPLAFRDIAGEQNGNGMQVRACQAPQPVVRMVGARGPENICSRGHSLTELLGKGGQRGFIHSECLQAV